MRPRHAGDVDRRPGERRFQQAHSALMRDQFKDSLTGDHGCTLTCKLLSNKGRLNVTEAFRASASNKGNNCATGFLQASMCSAVRLGTLRSAADPGWYVMDSLAKARVLTSGASTRPTPKASA